MEDAYCCVIVIVGLKEATRSDRRLFQYWPVWCSDDPPYRVDWRKQPRLLTRLRNTTARKFRTGMFEQKISTTLWCSYVDHIFLFWNRERMKGIKKNLLTERYYLFNHPRRTTLRYIISLLCATADHRDGRVGVRGDPIVCTKARLHNDVAK